MRSNNAAGCRMVVPGGDCGMLGNHSISLLTDAWVKGIRTFDPKKALEAYYHEATNKGPWGSANGRPVGRIFCQRLRTLHPKTLAQPPGRWSLLTMIFAATSWQRQPVTRFMKRIWPANV